MKSMADILDYFDHINIDVAKRKYYNVNKVNAVLEELRAKVVELVEENERQRLELDALRTERSQKQAENMQSRELLSEMQGLYRDTLAKAHERADGIIKDAETKSSVLMQETEEKKALAAEQVRACFSTLQSREEENIQFLNTRLKRILDVLDGTEKSSSLPISMIENHLKESVSESYDKSVTSNATDEAEEESFYGSGREQLKDLELQIQRLAKEINALESGI